MLSDVCAFCGATCLDHWVEEERGEAMNWNDRGGMIEKVSKEGFYHYVKLTRGMVGVWIKYSLLGLPHSCLSTSQTPTILTSFPECF